MHLRRRDEPAESIDSELARVELLDEIDFEAIADYWLARFTGYRRRESRVDL